MLGTTTDLADVRRSPRNFVWGKALNFHEIGPYTVIEYRDNTADTRPLQRMFHVYVNGEDTRRSFRSLKQALIGAIALDALGTNVGDHAANLIIKMLGVG